MDESVTLVTGAGGAVGSELVRLLAERRHKVAAVDMLEGGVRALAERYPKACAAYVFDAQDESDWKSGLERIHRELGPLNGAALCAGGWAGGVPVAAQNDDSLWRKMLDLNLETAEVSLRAILPGMVERGRGSIVVIGSRAVERPWESAGAAAYAAAKSALVTYAQAIAREVIDHGVRVNAVLPSVIDTTANRQAMPDADHARWVSTGSLAKIIAFLLSDEARDVYGAALPVYGRV